MEMQKVPRTIRDFAVHCSATTAGKHFTAADIERWHKAQGWDAIGYHFVILLDGTIELGRPLETIGSHVKGHNANSVGICLIGGVDAKGVPANTFTTKQFDSLELVLRGLRGRWPLARILGHRDYPGVTKACPSFDVSDWLATRGMGA